jgi:hypothetical protein
MAEMSYWWTTTGGVGSGDQVASYTQAHLSKVAQILAACAGFEGVAPGYLNSLACTAGGANTVNVNTGGAVVDGKAYLNDASVAVTVPSAVGAGNTRIDRIVLRASWAGFDIAITRIAGTDAASPTAPAITQTSGTTYDIQLCQVLVTTAGAVTVTDERTMASPLQHRQGGSATVWGTSGSTNYSPGPSRMQAGAVSLGTPLTSPATGSAAITFPVAFTYTPVIIVSRVDDNAFPVTLHVTASSSTGCTISYYARDVAAGAPIYANWLAIGPR